jgi:hypothetical protein
VGKLTIQHVELFLRYISYKSQLRTSVQLNKGKSTGNLDRGNVTGHYHNSIRGETTTTELTKWIYENIIPDKSPECKGPKKMLFNRKQEKYERQSGLVTACLSHFSCSRSGELFAPSPSSALDNNRFTDASLNGSEFSLCTLNDRPLEPEARTD